MYCKHVISESNDACFLNANTYICNFHIQKCNLEEQGHTVAMLGISTHLLVCSSA